MIITIRDIPYHIKIHQSDHRLPVMVLLHGFMGSAESFSHLTSMLTSCVNPVTIDLLGHGSTGGGQGPGRYHWKEQVEDLDRLLKKLSGKPVYLYGYSMGGRLALRYALEFPGRLEGLVLESTNPGIKGDNAKEERRRVDKARAVAIKNDFTTFLEEWNKLPLFTAGEDLPEEQKETYLKVQEQQDPQQMAFSLQGFGNANMPAVTNQLPRMALPVQLIAGERDEKYCSVMEEMHQLIPGSRFDRVTGAAHRVHLDQPGPVVTLVSSFITSNKHA